MGLAKKTREATESKVIGYSLLMNREKIKRTIFSVSAFQRFSVSAFQRFSVSAFQRFSVSAFQRFSVSAFTSPAPYRSATIRSASFSQSTEGV
jgi:hypothetical protein